MDVERALNIAMGCVVASHLDSETKREVLDILTELSMALDGEEDDS